MASGGINQGEENMAKVDEEKFSKEFQIKFRKEVGVSDEKCIAALKAVLRDISHSRRFDFKIKKFPKKSWRRHGERYDTAPYVGLFRENGLSLATEKAIKGTKKKKTKLKCKQHALMPESLYKKHKKSYCYPRVKDKSVKSKFKLEQDIHFNNCKYCATGYFKLDGTKHKFATAEDFLQYYPGLAKVPDFKKKLRLVKVKDWQETVFDGMEFKIGGLKAEGALVTRRDKKSAKWVESEFSFKIKLRKKKLRKGKYLDPAIGWDYQGLKELSNIYNEFFGFSDVFIQSPSIFYFSGPVGSREIRLVDE